MLKSENPSTGSLNEKSQQRKNRMDQNVKFADGKEQTGQGSCIWGHIIGNLNIHWAREAWSVQGRWRERGALISLSGGNPKGLC